METLFAPVAHEEAAGIIESKGLVSREVFDGLLPELRGRAFTVTGIEGANALQRVRDSVASLPRGAVWDEAKGDIAAELESFLGEEESQRRAELLLRTHGFQAFQAANWRVAQEDGDTTHLQYLATEDSHVRATHLALNGIVLPKDDEFWERHYPPWEWGCRCRVRAMNPDLVEEARVADEKRAPDDQWVLEGAAARALRDGTLIRDGRRYDVTPPADRRQEAGGSAFEWHPDDLRISLEELRGRYDEETWGSFERWAKGTKLTTDGTDGTDGETVWGWLSKGTQGTEGTKGQLALRPEPRSDERVGTPVSGALEVRRRDGAGLRRTLEAIDSVHGDGPLPHIEVDGRVHGRNAGEYEMTRSGHAMRIGVKRRPGEELTAAHEIGHFIDHQGFAIARGLFASEASEALAGWREAVMGSRLGRELREALGNARTARERKHLKYLLTGREMWARSYAQFIAEESGDAGMLTALRERTGTTWGYWEKEDFGRIREEIVKVFEGQGWMAARR